MSTQGIVCIARNNNEIDYTKQAYFLAKQVKDRLNLPTTVITDSEQHLSRTFPDYKTVFDKILSFVWLKDNLTDHKVLSNTESHTLRTYRDGANVHKKLQFKNGNRSIIYDYTPYDETLVLDTDMLILDKNYLFCFDQPHDFLIYNDSYDLAGHRDTDEFQYINDIGIKFYWATAVFFRKSTKNKIFFDLVQHIQDNWNHYRSVFQLGPGIYRNDHAFSIAIHIMDGYQHGGFAQKMPGKLFYTTDKDICWDITDDSVTFLLEKQNHSGEFTMSKWKGHNVHVMNKFSYNRCIDKILK